MEEKKKKEKWPKECLYCEVCNFLVASGARNDFERHMRANRHINGILEVQQEIPSYRFIKKLVLVSKENYDEYFLRPHRGPFKKPFEN